MGESQRLVLKFKEETSVVAFQLQFAWTSDPSAAYINKVERLTDKGELCRKLVAKRLFLCSVWKAPLTPWPLSEITQCHCHRGHSPTSSLWPMTAHSGGLYPHCERSECATLSTDCSVTWNTLYGWREALRAGLRNTFGMWKKTIRQQWKCCCLKDKDVENVAGFYQRDGCTNYHWGTASQRQLNICFNLMWFPLQQIIDSFFLSLMY